MIAAPRIVYPESDGMPSAENTVHFDWIALLKWNIEVLFHTRGNAFVAADNFIYPVEGDNRTRTAPDVYVAFGRPKGPRGSYRVWEEGNIFPQVIFEVLAPTIAPEEMDRKFEFYSRFGAEEYYVLQPDGDMHLRGWLRADGALHPAAPADPSDFVSPLLGVRFVKRAKEIRIHGPDGRRWGTPLQTIVWAEEVQAKAKLAAEAARRNEGVQRDIARYSAKLRELGLDPDAL